jgi:hypothetical protein
MRHGVIDHHGVVDMLAALEQRRAADIGVRLLAGEPHENLIAHHSAAGREGEITDAHLGANVRY